MASSNASAQSSSVRHARAKALRDGVEPDLVDRRLDRREL